jgi:N6-L-threonylcarbamoyladenine synthase
MKEKSLALGIDTSNYKTSVAIVSKTGEILFNSQKFLKVKTGERGLRQSEALFQHVKQLPDSIEEAFNDKKIREQIGCIGVSTRPRSVDGSYMPVFMAGESFARTIGAILDVPVYQFSHQDGHIEAIRHYSGLDKNEDAICFHFSGGTTEALLLYRNNEIVGGSKDLSYGQVLDRVGVALGYDFPCGEALDNIAINSSIPVSKTNIFTKIKVVDGFVNLSGIETQAQKNIHRYPKDEVVTTLFFRLAMSIEEMTIQLYKKYGVKNFIYVGGVSCSKYMRNFLREKLSDKINLYFGDSELSSDNAIGVALLGGKKLWR